MFYVAQALWTVPFSPGRISILVFMACLAACCAVVLFRIAWPEFGRGGATFLAVLFVALPVMQVYTHTVMAELLVLLFCLLAANSFARFLSNGATRDSVLFAVFASLAILTKANGWALALLPPLAVVEPGNGTCCGAPPSGFPCPLSV